MKYKLIALIGQSGSGKDTLLKSILTKNNFLHEVVGYTTRPKREKEIDGVHYKFVDNEFFADKLLNDQLLEVSHFNNWVYGTTIDCFDQNKVNIGIFDPARIDMLMSHKDKIDLYVYYIKVDDKERLIRQLNRQQHPDIDEIIRRYKTDKEDFCDIDEYFHYNELQNNSYKDLKNNVKIISAAARALQAKPSK